VFITVTAFYAGLLALLLLVLGMRLPLLRRRHQVSLGDGGVPALQRAVRMHGNAAETIPIGLILLAVLELQGFSLWILNAVGGSLLLGRILHPFGLAMGEVGAGWPRVAGMLLTWLSIGAAALLCLLAAVSNW